MILLKRIILAIALPLIFFSCSTSDNSKKKVGFLIRTFELDRCVKERDFFTQKMNELGGETLIADANNDDKLQVKQGLEMLEKGVDVLVIFSVNGLTSAQIVREAHKRNVKVIAYESLITDCDLDYFITADNGKGGELMTSYITKIAPQGNYVLIGGNKADKNAILIKTGQHKVLDPFVKSGGIKILYDVYADWSAEEGYHETSRVLDLSDVTPDAIIASNDGIATGVSMALGERGLAGKVLLTGLDGELTALQRIAQGTQSVTIYKSFKKQAYAAAEMAFKLANSQKPEGITSETFNGSVNVPTFLIEPIAIDKTTLSEVIKDGVFSDKEIYSNE